MYTYIFFHLVKTKVQKRNTKIFYKMASKGVVDMNFCVSGNILSPVFVWPACNIVSRASSMLKGYKFQL